MRMRYWAIDLLMRTELWAIQKRQLLLLHAIAKIAKKRGVPVIFMVPPSFFFNLTREVGLSYAKLLLHRQRNY